MIFRCLFWTLLAFVCLSHAARADDSRPLTITVVEDATNTYRVTWKIPVNIQARHLPEIAPPVGCSIESPARRWSDSLGHWRAERWRCTQGLEGRSLAISYPFANPNLATIARLRMKADEEQTLLLRPQQTQVDVPRAKARHGTFADFLQLGFEHIWQGIDHLLFVVGLIFIAGTFRRVLATISAFTIAHSITLALSAIDAVRLPIGAVEGVIALSIVFLAVEVVKGPRDTVTWRRPTAVAGSFGLLHGFGFAAALREIGLPNDAVLSSLAAFNIGIELGQIAFAASLMLTFALARRSGREVRFAANLQQVGGYGVGILASYWMFQRLAGI